MTPIEIAYFKHFMYDKGLEKSFLFYYRRNPIKGSPKGDKYANSESIEQFFLRTTVQDVIMKAFTFYPSGNAVRDDSTFDYWKNIDDQWQDYMHSMASNISNDSWPLLRRTFAILRQNWDIPGYWRKENFESTEEVYKRMHIDLPLPEIQWEHGYIQHQRADAELIRFSISEAKDGDVIVRIKRTENGFIRRWIILFRELVSCEVEGAQVQRLMAYAYYNCSSGKMKIGGETRSKIVDPEAKNVAFRLAFEGERKTLMDKLEESGFKWDDSEKALVPLVEEKEQPTLIDFAEKEEDPLSDFDFFDDILPGNYRLKSNEISINFNKGYKITFNQIDSKIIRDSGLKFVRLAKSKDGDICLIINRQKGATLTNLSGRAGNMNATINSVDICGKLRTLFNLKSDYSILRVAKLQTTKEFIIYKVTIQ